MKRLITSILLICTFAHTAIAAPGVTRNDNAASVINGTNLGGATIGVDENGRVWGSPIGNTVTLTGVQTVAATAHAANDVVGGKMTLAGAVRASAGSGVIQSVTIFDKAGQAGSYDVLFFTADPSATTITDDSPLTLNDADGAKVICPTPVTTTSTFVDNGVTGTTNIGCAFEVASGTTIYAVVIARTAVTFASTSDITVRISILQD